MSSADFFRDPPVDPDNQGIGMAVNAVTWLMTLLAVITVGVRFYLRRNIARFWRLDDWLMLGAVVTQLLCQILLSMSIYWGMGRPYTSITMDQYVQKLKYEFIEQTPGYVVEMLARTSIAILLNRIFCLTRPWFKWMIVVFTVLTWVVGLLCIAVLFAQESPLAAWWDPRIKPWRNIGPYPEAKISLAFQFLVALSDLLYVVLPVTFVWRVKMQRSRKIGLVVLLSVSLITVAAQLGKIVLAIYAIQGRGPLVDLANSYLVGTVIYLVSMLEQSLVITAGCVPTLGPLAKLDFTTFAVRAASLISILTRSSRSVKSDSEPPDQFEKLEMGRLSREGSADAHGQKGMGPDTRILHADDRLFTQETRNRD